MSFKDTVELVAKVLDSAGVAVVIAGIFVATALFVAALSRSTKRESAYRTYRSGIGRAILLSLEFLVAADIIRTVAIAPTFRGVGVLAVIVLVRTFLSMALELELSGKWPWQKRAPETSAK